MFIHKGPKVLTKEVLFYLHTPVSFVLPAVEKGCLSLNSLFLKKLIHRFWFILAFLESCLIQFWNCRILTLVSSYCISIREIFFSRKLTFTVAFLTESSAIILSLQSVFMALQKFMGNHLSWTQSQKVLYFYFLKNNSGMHHLGMS